MDTIVAHTHPFVIGVDTHARTHTYAVLTAAGQHLGTETFPNTPAGRSRAIAWSGRRSGGDLDVLWVIEGAGSYGAQLAGDVARTGYRDDSPLNTGRENGMYVGKSPVPVTLEMLEQGQTKFNIYCAPCHDQTGMGHGIVPTRVPVWQP